MFFKENKILKNKRWIKNKFYYRLREEDLVSIVKFLFFFEKGI